MRCDQMQQCFQVWSSSYNGAVKGHDCTCTPAGTAGTSPGSMGQEGMAVHGTNGLVPVLLVVGLSPVSNG